MTITISKFKLVVSVLAITLLGAGVAYASHSPFTDVPEGAFYEDPVEWLYDNELTTGSPSGSDTFKPLNNVTRGEYATFNYRYDQNVVQPALGRVGYEHWVDTNDWDGTEPLDSVVSVEALQDGFLVINYTANIGVDADSTGTGVGYVVATLRDNIGGEVAEVYQMVDFDKHEDLTLALTHVLPVDAGVHGISVTLSFAPATGQLVYVYSESFNATFVPTGEEGPALLSSNQRSADADGNGR